MIKAPSQDAIANAESALGRLESQWEEKSPSYWVGVLSVALESLIRECSDDEEYGEHPQDANQERSDS